MQGIAMPEVFARDALLNMNAVLARTGLSRSTIHRLRKRGVFPRPTRVGERCVRWSAAEIDRWVEKQLSNRQAA